MSYWMLGLQAVQMLGGLQEARAQAEMQNRVRKAQNKVLLLTASENVNAAVRNSVSAFKRSQQVAQIIQQERVQAVGEAEVSAASAGVKGKSVDVGISHLHRVAATKDFYRQEELRQQYQGNLETASNAMLQAQVQYDSTSVKPDYMGIVGSSLMDMAGTFFSSKEKGGIGGMQGLKSDWARASAGGGSIMSNVGNLLFRS